MQKAIVVGCGLCGCVVARELAENDWQVHIVERRNHVGGNVYDYFDYNGILVQKYGPHIFFTDDERIEKYVNRFCKTTPIFPQCRTIIDGKSIPIPFNFASIDLIYEKEHAEALKASLIDEFGENAIVSVVDVISSSNKDIHDYGKYMFDNEYRKYSAKQWGRPIESIDEAVFKRVPVYISYKQEYLRNKYQFLPEGGFTKLIKEVLNHKNIEVTLETDANRKIEIDEDKKKIIYDKTFSGPIIYTGPLDSLFGYSQGKLPYRSLEFTWKEISKTDTIEKELCAFPESDKYIRITDYTKLPPQEFGDKAYIAIEYPLEYKCNELCGNEPYYPIKSSDSEIIYKEYEQLAGSISNLYPCGRLADYKYYNMDQVIIRAMEISKTILDAYPV